MITSRDNEKLKLVRKLAERRWRDKLGLFVCEGEDLVAAATASPVELLVAGENVEPGLLAEVSSAAHPPRVIGVYRRSDLPAPEQRPAVLALWRVADPGNLGTLIRTADAFGASVALADGCADPTGAEGAARVGGLDLARAARPVRARCWLWRPTAGGERGRPHRVALVAGGGTPLWEADLRGRVIFLLGAERDGLPDSVERDHEAWIPIASESLNVAVAGSIALYEWRRQNRQLGADAGRCS